MENDRPLKLVLIGDTGVGKSCIFLRDDKSDLPMYQPATIGVDFISKRVSIGDKKVKLQVWDTAGAERFRSLEYSYYRMANGVLIVYDISSRKSFTSVSKRLEEVKKGTKPETPVILVGNKADLESERAVTTEEAAQFAQERNMMFMEISAKEGRNVENVFTNLATAIVMQKLDPTFASEETTLKLKLKKTSTFGRFFGSKGKKPAAEAGGSGGGGGSSPPPTKEAASPPPPPPAAAPAAGAAAADGGGELVRCFASMRFGKGSPKKDVLALSTKLKALGVDLIVYEENIGNIKSKVEQLMESCKAFLACGTQHYGEETDSTISSFKEVAYWQEYMSDRSIVRLRMIPFSAKHNVGAARGLFTKDQNQILWEMGQPLTDKIVSDVARAIKAAADI